MFRRTAVGRWSLVGLLLVVVCCHHIADAQQGSPQTPPYLLYLPLQSIDHRSAGAWFFFPASRTSRSQPAVRHPRVVRPLSGRQRRQQRRPGAAQLRLVHRSAVRHAPAALRQSRRAGGQRHRLRARLRAGAGGRRAAGGRSRDGRLWRRGRGAAGRPDSAAARAHRTETGYVLGLEEWP